MVVARVTDENEYFASSLVDLYVLAGTLEIGLRRWSPQDLGLNRCGLGLGLACCG
jgi:hypothetical protein